MMLKKVASSRSLINIGQLQAHARGFSRSATSLQMDLTQKCDSNKCSKRDEMMRRLLDSTLWPYLQVSVALRLVQGWQHSAMKPMVCCHLLMNIPSQHILVSPPIVRGYIDHNLAPYCELRKSCQGKKGGKTDLSKGPGMSS